MSNRVLKKLQGEREVSVVGLGVADGFSESDDGGPGHNSAESGRTRKQLAPNRFELLNSVDHSLSDTEAKEDDDREIEPSQEQERNKLEKQDSAHSTDSLKRKKKKKKKKMKSQKSTEDNLNNGEDEIDASIKEVNKLLGEPVCSPPSSSATAEKCVHKNLLSIDHRNLNPENEMKRIFGSKIVQAEQVKRRGRSKSHGKSTFLVTPRNWPSVGKSGVSMSLLETKGDTHFFTLEHNKQYQAVQFQFLDAVESFNPDNIVALLNVCPYHVDALIQFSDICRMGEDMQMAAELIERALYSLECSFHPLFNVTQGNCRLDYRRGENRSFFIALFKHLQFVGQRGCNRTALEFSKLLLGLDPEGDPLGATLIIDFYALRSEQYDFLVSMFGEWERERNLSQLPNFAFSVPLAMCLQARQENKSLEPADQMLQSSLIMFPGLLMPLLDKCGVQPDAHVARHPFFGPKAQSCHTSALNQLVALYIGRCYVVWKDKDVISWLEYNVKQVLKRVDEGDPYVKECKEKCKVRYQGTPHNILRHIILSNVKEATVTLPQDLTHTPIFGFDPLPPADAITTYTRPPRSEASGDHGVLSTFFRSLLPNFNLAEGAASQAPANRDPADAPQPRTDTNDLRHSVTSLLDAMRDLLSNIHLADIPNEGDVDSDDEHED